MQTELKIAKVKYGEKGQCKTWKTQETQRIWISIEIAKDVDFTFRRRKNQVILLIQTSDLSIH